LIDIEKAILKKSRYNGIFNFSFFVFENHDKIIQNLKNYLKNKINLFNKIFCLFLPLFKSIKAPSKLKK